MITVPKGTIAAPLPPSDGIGGTGRPASYTSNITGPWEISLELWLVGSEAHATADFGELGPILIPKVARHARYFFCLCGTINECPDSIALDLRRPTLRLELLVVR